MLTPLAFDPYAAARVAREIDLIKAANPGCYTLLEEPYVVVQTPTGIVLQKAGRQKVAPGQIYTLLEEPYVMVQTPTGIVLQKAARRKVAPGQMSLFGGGEHREGETRINDAGHQEVLQGSRWHVKDEQTPAAAKPALAVLRDEPSDRPPIAEMQSTGYDRGEVSGGDAMPKFDVVSDRESQPEGTLFYDDPGVTPEQKEFMERGGQNYIPPTIASRAEIDDIFPDVATTAEKARGYGYQGKDDYEVVARYMNGGAARMVGNNNVYPVHFTDEPSDRPPIAEMQSTGYDRGELQVENQMENTRTRRILGNGPAMKPQLAARYRLKEKAKDAYAEYLIAEYDVRHGAYTLAEAVIEKVIAEFKASLSPNAPRVTLADADVLAMMASDAVRIGEAMDGSGELDRIMDAAQTREDQGKHDF